MELSPRFVCFAVIVSLKSVSISSVPPLLILLRYFSHAGFSVPPQLILLCYSSHAGFSVPGNRRWAAGGAQPLAAECARAAGPARHLAQGRSPQVSIDRWFLLLLTFFLLFLSFSFVVR